MKSAMAHLLLYLSLSSTVCFGTEIANESVFRKDAKQAAAFTSAGNALAARSAGLQRPADAGTTITYFWTNDEDHA